MSGQAGAVDPAVAVPLVTVAERLAERWRGGRRALAQRNLGALFGLSSGGLRLHHDHLVSLSATRAHEQGKQQHLSHALSLTSHHRDATAPIRHENQGTGRNHSGTP